MAFEYDSVIDACIGLVKNNKDNAYPNMDTLVDKVATLTNIANEAFTSKHTVKPMVNIALKEMYDFAKSSERFVKVFIQTRKDYYADATDFYDTHIKMLEHQKSVFNQLYTKGTT
jgi:hypothetical protein